MCVFFFSVVFVVVVVVTRKSRMKFCATRAPRFRLLKKHTDGDFKACSPADAEVPVR